MFITDLFCHFLHYFYLGTSKFTVGTGSGMPGCSYTPLVITNYHYVVYVIIALQQRAYIVSCDQYLHDVKCRVIWQAMAMEAIHTVSITRIPLWLRELLTYSGTQISHPYNMLMEKYRDFTEIYWYEYPRLSVTLVTNTEISSMGSTPF